MSIEQTNSGSVARQDPSGTTEAIPAAVAAELAGIRREIAELRAQVPEDRAALVVFSGDLDRAIAAFIIATGAAAAGLETTLFFTFWGLSILKKKNGASVAKKDLMQKMFAVMTPSSSESLGVSKMNYFGIGATMLRTMMKKQEVSSLEELVELAREMGVRMIGCTMSMDVMGIDKDDLFDGIDLGGVAAFMGEAARARLAFHLNQSRHVRTYLQNQGFDSQVAAKRAELPQEKTMNAEQAISVEQLLGKSDAGEPFLLLDVRNNDEYEAWKVEGRRPIEMLHIPYFDFVEDPDLVSQVPSDGREVLVLCAKGGSSEFVADLLREAGINAKNIEGGMIAYGDYLQPVRVPLDRDEVGHFEIWQLNRRGKGCLSYVIRCGAEAVVVDPSRNVGEYERFVKQLGARLVWVFDTHVHADHLSGGAELARLSGARYFVSAGNGGELKQAVTPVRDGEEIRLGDDPGSALVIRVVETPGHTPGSTSFLVGRRLLLTGDTIFVSGIGRPDLGGHVVEWSRDLYHTLHERIGALPDEIVILPAHYSGVSEIRDDGVVTGLLGEIRRAVPELQLRSQAEFVEAMKAALSAPPETYAQIIETNLGTSQASAEEAAEWELGKNQCAASGH